MKALDSSFAQILKLTIGFAFIKLTTGLLIKHSFRDQVELAGRYVYTVTLRLFQSVDTYI